MYRDLFERVHIQTFRATMASKPGDIGASKEDAAAQKPTFKAEDLAARVEDEADVPDPDEDDLDDLDGR